MDLSDASEVAGTELAFAPATGQARQVRSGDVSSVELVELGLDGSGGSIPSRRS